jgi:hypothetical protein
VKIRKEIPASVTFVREGNLQGLFGEEMYGRESDEEYLSKFDEDEQ